MLKSLKSNSYRFVVVLLLLLTFLTTGMVGKVVSSYALADPVPELAPVFDTQIYQLKDYVNENIVDTPKEPIFYMLMGAYLVSQAGMNQYELIDPYTTQDGVTGWLKSTGIQLYNSLVDFIPYDPINGTDLRPIITGLVGYALGAAGLANSYSSEQDFIDDINNNDYFYLPFDKSLQLGVNAVLEQNGGLHDWQLHDHDFQPLNWNYRVLPSQTGLSYMSYIRDMNFPIHANSLYSNLNIDCTDALKQYDNVFFNIARSKVYLCDDYGNEAPTSYNSRLRVSGVAVSSFNDVYLNTYECWFKELSFSGTNFVELLDSYFYNGMFFVATNSNQQYCCTPDVTYYFEKAYYGNDWNNKTEITLQDTLNFAINSVPYYLQVQNDYLLDLKGLLSSLLGITSLQTQILNNLYDLNGNLVNNPSLISVSIDLPDTNPLPVNLNDIQLYTDNEYLDIVKDRSLQASETIGEYIAFWHNCDAELVYAILGSFIVILIGAFIGKWGHS